MTTTITRLYDDYADAERAVRRLEDAGVPKSDTSIVANDSESWYRPGGKVDRDQDGVDELARRRPLPQGVHRPHPLAQRLNKQLGHRTPHFASIVRRAR